MEKKEIEKIIESFQDYSLFNLVLIARERGVKTRIKMKKKEVILAIAKKQIHDGGKVSYPELTKSDETKSSFEWKRKEEVYIKTASEGSVIAFQTKEGKPVRSAIVLANDEEKKTLKVQTKNNQIFTIKYNQVLWVRTGARWPKGVYQLLKGVKNDCQ